MRYLSSLQNKDLSGKICLLRVDLNTEDNWRLEASLPTILFLVKRCKALVILSHRGRPDKTDKALSLKKDVQKIENLLSQKILFLAIERQSAWPRARKKIRSASKGTIFVLENLRFLKGEAENSDELAKNLASLGDFYVNDAFAVSHRKNASVVAITKYIESYAGLELESEIKNLSHAARNPKQPFVVLLGGAKVADKSLAIKNLSRTASLFLIGGKLNKKLLTAPPSKSLIALDFKKEGGVIYDIGPKTVKIFSEKIRQARTIIFSGPMGDISQKKFENGTRAIARAVANNLQAFKIVGGGETVMFLRRLKLDKKMDFISTGGGAMLDFLAGKRLPGIKALGYEFTN